jgi:tetratricopeptide (TPR) repeat protein
MGVAVARDATWKDCELAARDPDRSIAACSKLLKRPSSRAHAAAFHHRGQAYAAKGKLDKAISDISAGIRLDPERAYLWQERGQFYARQGKYQQAIADITEAIKRDPTPRAFRFHSRAEAYQSLGDLTRAIADYDEAIRLDPEARSFRFRARANALRDAGQYDRALADYETALKLTPTNVLALVDRGRTYAKMGRSEDAKNDFDGALRLDPANEEKLRPVIEAEVAALPATVQKPPPQSPPSEQPSTKSETSPTRQNPAAVAQGESAPQPPNINVLKVKPVPAPTNPLSAKSAEDVRREATPFATTPAAAADSNPSFLQAGIFFMTGQEPPKDVQLLGKKTRELLNNKGSMEADVAVVYSENAWHQVHWGALPGEYHPPTRRFRHEYDVYEDEPCTIYGWLMESPYGKESLNFKTLPSPRAMKVSTPALGRLGVAMVLPTETWCRYRANPPEHRTNQKEEPPFPHITGSGKCLTDWTIVGPAEEMYRRLEALDYIRANFCPGQPEPPKKPY